MDATECCPVIGHIVGKILNEARSKAAGPWCMQLFFQLDAPAPLCLTKHSVMCVEAPHEVLSLEMYRCNLGAA